jgi:DNA-binding NarL/FixJ family response regulator
MIGAHWTEDYPDKATARAASRRLRISRRIDTAPRFCADCKTWHIASADRRINETDRLVIAKVALGLRAHEIAQDIGESESQVVNRLKALMQHFDALSRANLVALAIFFGVIDIAPIAINDERKAIHG